MRAARRMRSSPLGAPVSATDAPQLPQGPKGPADLALAAVQALRPKQWAKNVFLFAAILFSMRFGEVGLWVKTLMGFAAFSLVSSSGYIFNDAKDVESDRQHPRKRKRAIASGRLPVKLAYVEMLLVFLAGAAIAYAVNPWFLLVVLLYFCTTMSYSAFLKNVVILDVMFIASGFLWRAAGGAVAIEVPISPWLLTCTGFLALFFGFNKRRGELAEVNDAKSGHTRKNLAQYTPELVVEFQAITTSGTILSYALYCVLASPTPWLLLTMPHVLYGMFRYIYLVTAHNEGGAPDETLFRDRAMLVTGALYALTVLAILLFAPMSAASSAKVPGMRPF